MGRRNQKSHIALLTNFVPPTRLPVFEFMAKTAPMTVFTDVVNEPNREWQVRHGHLNVETAPGWSFERKYRHPTGFEDRAYIHVPLGLLGVLLKRRPSHVLTGELGFRTAVACIYKLVCPRTRLVAWVEGTPHTDRCRGWIRSMWRRIALRIPTAVVATSAGAKDLACSYGIPESKVVVSYQTSGFGPPQEPVIRTPEQRRRLLYAGQLIARKGVRPLMETLRKVAAAMPDREIEIWFAGTGPEEAWLKDQALPPNLTMRLLGSVAYDEMSDVYRQCGVLVFPTLADVWGLVTNEAMAYSMPVLGSLYAQSVCDLVEDGKTGWTFRADDAEGLRRACEHAVTTDIETLEAMGRQARVIAKKITPEQFGSDLLEAVLGEAAPTNGNRPSRSNA